jgi:hypothetical protein
MTSPEQLELPLAVTGEPTRPAAWVAQFLGVPVDQVHAAIDAGDLPATHDGEHWQVPLWAIPAFADTIG